MQPAEGRADPHITCEIEAGLLGSSVSYLGDGEPQRSGSPPSLAMGASGHSEPLRGQDSFTNILGLWNRTDLLRQMFMHVSDQISQGFSAPAPLLVQGVLPLPPLLGRNFLRGKYHAQECYPVYCLQPVIVS